MVQASKFFFYIIIIIIVDLEINFLENVVFSLVSVFLVRCFRPLGDSRLHEELTGTANSQQPASFLSRVQTTDQ